MNYLMKYQDQQRYGGPEEGGWYYDFATPQWTRGIPLPLPSELCYKICRYLNRREQAKPHDYEYTSVLSHREDFFSYGLEDYFTPTQPQTMRYE